MSDLHADDHKVLLKLELVANRKYSFLLAAYTLYSDSVLIAVYGVGILDYVQRPELMKFPFALTVFLMFVLFSFLVALVMPAVSKTMNDIVLGPIWDVWSGLKLWMHRQLGLEDRFVQDSRPGMSDVSIHELKLKAHSSRELYFLELLEVEESRANSERRVRDTTRFFAVTTLVIATYNFSFLGAQSLLNRCAEFLGTTAWGWGLLILIAINAFGDYFAAYKVHWVYCPVLSLELENDRRQKH